MSPPTSRNSLKRPAPASRSSNTNLIARLASRDWLVALFAKDQLLDAERGRLLRATPPQGEQDAGAIVCSCFSVGVNTLAGAIRDQGLITPEALGEVLGAGTNCGSCVPEIRRLIAEVRLDVGVG